jgi:quinol monooxygenase YgiN
MYDLAFRMTAVAGDEDGVWAALVTTAEASRQEPGVHWFEALRSGNDPRTMLVVERYASREAYEAHKETAHYAAWKAASAGRIEASERFVGGDAA